MVARKASVIFLCSGNSARSQMAEAFLRLYGGDHFDAFSAGLEARGIAPNTIKVMDERGIDIRQQESKSIGSIGGLRYYNYIITVCSRDEKDCPRDHLVLGSQRLYWPFDNPVEAKETAEVSLQKFREVREQIEAQIQNWIKHLELN